MYVRRSNVGRSPWSTVGTSTPQIYTASILPNNFKSYGTSEYISKHVTFFVVSYLACLPRCEFLLQLLVGLLLQSFPVFRPSSRSSSSTSSQRPITGGSITVLVGIILVFFFLLLINSSRFCFSRAMGRQGVRVQIQLFDIPIPHTCNSTCLPVHPRSRT